MMTLIWPKLLITDRGSEFKGDCERMLRDHNVEFQKAKSKRTVGIVENFNKILRRKCWLPQDASDQLLPITERFWAWVKNLQLIVANINNSITRPIDMALDLAIEMEEVIAKPSQPRDGPMGYDEEQLDYNTSVRYLLIPDKLDGDGRHHVGDLNWSPYVYYIRDIFVQKNQPILYWLLDDEGNGPERSFVKKSFKSFLTLNCHPNGSYQIDVRKSSTSSSACALVLK